MKLQRYAVVTGAGLMAVASLTACSSSKSTPSASGSSSTTTAAGSSSSSTTPAATAPTCATGKLAMSGSSAQANAMSQWTTEYNKACSGAQTVYTSSSSGNGYTDFTNKTSDMSGSDYPLAAAQQAAADARCGTGNKAVDIPAVPGAIAVLYNVKGISGTAPLNLSASTIAKIFTGKITTWNDAAIQQDNPGVTLPATKITPFFRSDGSGTSFNFSNYLNNVAAADFPSAANKNWPGKVGNGVQGSKSIAQGVSSTDGAIGYAELSYASTANVTAANIGNAGGKFVSPSPDNAAAFFSKAKVVTNGADTRINFDYTVTDANAYPADLVTYEFVCATGNDSTKLPLIQGFLNYILSPTAQAELPNSGYVQMPATIASQLETVVAGLK